MNRNIRDLEYSTTFAENMWSAQFEIKDKNLNLDISVSYKKYFFCEWPICRILYVGIIYN